MRLKYETGVATLIQFVTLSALNIATGIGSVVDGCRAEEGDCLGNALLSLVFYVLIASWFGFVWFLGYTAQARRSKRLAQLLIGAELAILAVASFNIRLNRSNDGDILSLATSLIDVILALWVIFLAYRLMRSGGGRITGRQRRRRRRISPAS